MSNSATLPAIKFYPFPQQPAIITKSVSNGIDSLLRMGVDARFILDIYLNAQQYSKIMRSRASQGLESVQSPYRYLSKAQGMTTEQLRVSAQTLESTFNTVILNWGSIAPLEFLAEYHAFFHSGRNETGLENGMISQRLFAAVQSQEGMLIVDPSPSFLQHIAADDTLCNRPITFAFSDPRRATICRQHPWPLTITVINTDQLHAPYNQFRTACIMASTTEYSVTADVLEKIQKAGIETIFLLAPTAFYDYKRKSGTLRLAIAKTFDLQQIVLISYSLENAAAEDEKVKRCMLAMYNRAPSGQNIYVESVALQNNSLVVSKPIPITHAAFAECRLTLGALYRQATRVSSGEPKRHGTSQVFFSPEISFWTRIETIVKEGSPTKYRAVFRFYEFASQKQKSRNKNDRGSFIFKAIGSTADSPAAALTHLDSIILPDSGEEKHLPGDLATIIRGVIEKHFGSNIDLTLKTFWFQRLPELLKNANYNHSLCCELFLGPQWDKNPLCHILVNDQEKLIEQTADEKEETEAEEAEETEAEETEETEEEEAEETEETEADEAKNARDIGKSTEIRRALDKYAAANTVSKTQQANILEQLHLIWQFYVEKHPKSINPVTPLIEASAQIDDTKEEMREALAVRAWTLEQMQALGKIISLEVTDLPMVLAIKCKLYLGLSSGELSALVMGSFDPHKNTLVITHNMPQTGSEANEYAAQTERQPYAHKWKKRIISVPDALVEELTKLVAYNQEGLYDMFGIEAKNASPYPLFPSRSNPKHPLLTRRINEQCKKLVELLNIPPWVISCPDDNIETDLNNYGKDSWSSNWRFQAYHAMNLDAGSVNYLSGVKPELVTDGNYRDFESKYQRRKFQLAHEKLMAHVYYAGKAPDQAWQSVALRKQRRIIPYTPRATANELVVTYDTAEGENVELTINIPHGCYVDIQYE